MHIYKLQAINNRFSDFVIVPPPEGGWVGKTNCDAVALASLRIVR
jgi:hypothetical protein